MEATKTQLLGMIHATMRASNKELLANTAARDTESEEFLLACAERLAMDKFKDVICDGLFCLVEWCVSDPIEMMYLGVREERRDRIV